MPKDGDLRLSVRQNLRKKEKEDRPKGSSTSGDSSAAQPYSPTPSGWETLGEIIDQHSGRVLGFKVQGSRLDQPRTLNPEP